MLPKLPADNLRSLDGDLAQTVNRYIDRYVDRYVDKEIEKLTKNLTIKAFS